MKSMLLSHGDGAHMASSSTWAIISMIAFSLFLLSIAWSLLHRTGQDPLTAEMLLTERYARGEINDEEFTTATRNLGRTEGRGA